MTRLQAVNLRGLNDVTVDASPAVEVPTPTIGYASRHYQDFMFFNTDVQTSSSSAMLSRLDVRCAALGRTQPPCLRQGHDTRQS